MPSAPPTIRVRGDELSRPVGTGAHMVRAVTHASSPDRAPVLEVTAACASDQGLTRGTPPALQPALRAGRDGLPEGACAPVPTSPAWTPQHPSVLLPPNNPKRPCGSP